MEFQVFPKIARLSRDVVITEKIDGTNAQITITMPTAFVPADMVIATHPETHLVMFAGSRSKYLRPGRDGVKGEDNFGFATWVQMHAGELWALGEGRHYGEWWGSGIQRGYGLSKGEKRFSLFNVSQWHTLGSEPYVMQGEDPRQPPKLSQPAPACCGVVPLLYRGPFDTSAISTEVERLHMLGSVAARGFMKPEGIVVFHTASGTLFKHTLELDGQPKGRN